MLIWCTNTAHLQSLERTRAIGDTDNTTMTSKAIQDVEKILPGIPMLVISQGAEAIVFKTSVHPYCNSPALSNTTEFIVKYRPSKRYRHPKLDASITKSRTIGEAKFMHKLTKLGINAPSLILVDLKSGLLWMECLGDTLASGEVSSFKNRLWHVERNGTKEDCLSDDIKEVCKNVGSLIAKLHINDMIHGDLTSSNIMLQGGNDAYLIDFGLSSYSGLAEDKAVDLYVLERAIQSTHSVYADSYNQWLLEGYQEAHGDKQTKKKYADVIGRLEDVRLRGRKRSMLG